MTIPSQKTSTSYAENLLAVCRRLSTLGLGQEFLANPENIDLLEDFFGDWEPFALPHQSPPDFGADGTPWTTWLLIGGRGAGKTFAGAQWVKRVIESKPAGPIALVGETEHDMREVMVEGVSGILRAYPARLRPQWIPTRKRLEWPNGYYAQGFSAEDPESLRGPQFAAAWCDELAKWRYADEAFDMLQFGLRLGAHPRQAITTTPRPTALIKRLIKDQKTAVTRATTFVNARNLAPAFFDAVIARYKGTRLGRQELDGEIVEERADALWTRTLIETCRVDEAPPLLRVVVAVDPPASSREGADACGLVAAGIAEGGGIYVIADETQGGLTPAGWSRKAIALWRRLQADALVVEVNQGGEMVRAIVAEADPDVPVLSVYAKKGKYLRAEPVAALFEQGRVRLAGAFPQLEDEMCDFALDGLSSGRSPDRLDAMVWAVSALSFGARGQPRVRGF